MKRQIAIMIAIYVVVETLYTLIGNPDSNVWAACYFLNQSILIIGALSLLRNFISNILIELAIALNVVKCLFNMLVLVNPVYASVINTEYYVGLVIVFFVLFVLVIKQIKT
jgi:hypothetical protein